MISELSYFTSSLISNLALSALLIVALAIGVEVNARWRRIRSKFGVVRFQARYAMPYLMKQLASAAV